MSNGQGLYTAADASRWSANAGSLGRTGAKAGGLAIIADSPSRLSSRGGTTGFERFLLVVRTILMSVVTAVTWNLVPAVGVILAIIGTYFTARAVAALADTPLRIGTFARLVKRTVDWKYLIGGFALVAVTVLHRSVVLEWIPSGIRTWTFWLASAILIVAIVGSAVLGRMAIVEFNAALAREAETEASLAHALGGNPRALFEPSPQTGMVAASWNFAGTSIVVTPQANVDLAGVNERLAQTALGQQFEVAEADWSRILLVPISAETLERQRHRQQSGGLIDAESDLDATTPMTSTAIDPDDPYASVAPVAEDISAADPDDLTFTEEDWR